MKVFKQTPKFYYLLIIICIFFANFALAAPFQEPLEQLSQIKPENVIRFIVKEIKETKVQSVIKYQIVLKLETRAGFKIYTDKFSFTTKDSLGIDVNLNYVGMPNAVKFYDKFYQKERLAYLNDTIFTVDYTDIPTTNSIISTHFESCSNSTCLLPSVFTNKLIAGDISEIVKENDTEIDFPSSNISLPPLPQATINSVGKSLSAASLEKESSIIDNFNKYVEQLLQKNSFILFPALFLAGLLMNLTPCVYPMIPISVNVLGRISTSTNAQPKRFKKLISPIVYILGMSVSYSAMGIVAALTGNVFGSILQSTFFTISFSILFFLLGLSMLGCFDFGYFQELGAKIKINYKFPLISIFLMGGVSGLVAAPCTGPILSMLLLMIAQSKDVILGFGVMFVFALGFGFPYLILGYYSQKLFKLPKGGYLLIAVKYIFATLIFGLSLYYLRLILSNLIGTSIVLFNPKLIGIILSFCLGIFLALISHKIFGLFSKISFIMGILILSLSMYWGTLFITHSFAEESPTIVSDISCTSEVVASKISWQTNWDAAIQCAESLNKPLLIDIWAEWCTACKELDTTIWNDTQIITQINSNYIPLKLDYTDYNKALTEKIKIWGIQGLPAILIINSKTQDTPIKTWFQVPTIQQFLLELPK